MKRMHGLTILLLSIIRKRLSIIVLLVVLPPTLIFLTLSLTVNSVAAYSERLLGYVSGTSITIDENIDSRNCCLPIKYGLVTIIRYETLLQAQVIVVSDVMELKNLTNTRLRISEDYCGYARVSVSSALLKELNISLGDFLEVCVGKECFTACVKYSHDGKLENFLILEGINGIAGLNRGFMCVRDAREVGEFIIGSLIRELTEFSEGYALIILLSYIPVLYLANTKLLERLGEELRILSTQGLSTSNLRLIFTLSTSMIAGLVTLYTIALSYLIVSAGVAVMKTLMNPVLPMPEPRAGYLILAALIFFLNFPVSYLAFTLGDRRVSN